MSHTKAYSLILTLITRVEEEIAKKTSIRMSMTHY